MDPESISSNPYAAPTSVDGRIELDLSQPRKSSYVWQVQFVGIGMIIQGVLESLYGVYMILLFSFMPNFTAGQTANMTPDQRQAFDIIMYVSAAIGAVLLLLAILRIAAGVLAVQYRGRLLGIITSLLGLISLMTCYCLPTAVGLCVYTLIIFLNPDVVQAFKMRSEGMSIADIRQYFA